MFSPHLAAPSMVPRVAHAVARSSRHVAWDQSADLVFVVRIGMRTVLLDRDGVINENRVDGVKSWTEFRFVPRALDALRLLTRNGFRIFVITNQAIVNRGVVECAVIEDIHRRMVRAAELHGSVLTEVRYCPHREDERCRCRKPEPGMLLEVARKHQVDLQRSYFVGDALTDIAAGQAVGCQTILTLTGRGRAQLSRPEAQLHRPSYVADDLWHATQWVIAAEGGMEREVGGQWIANRASCS